METISNSSERGYTCECGFDNPPRARFCAGCGSARDDVTQAQPERRHLSVMFCDLVGSTTLAAALDVEDLSDIVTAYQDACARVIEAHEGYVAQYLGDGLLAYFGYPNAREDDARRAVSAGLGVVRAIAELPPPISKRSFDNLPALSVRVGIHTGPVVTGAVGTGRHRELLALGQAPNIAARLQGLAQPGSVMLGETTAALTSGYFDLESCGPQQLRNVPEPVHAYRVLREGPARTRFDQSVAQGLTPFQERELELELISTQLEVSRQRGCHVLALTGEAGIGKSRLIHRALELSEGWGCRGLLSRCSARDALSAFAPIGQLLQVLLEIPVPEPFAPGPRRTRDKVRELQRLRRGLDGMGLDDETHQGAIAELLGLASELNMLPSDTSERRRATTIHAMSDVFFAAARQRPLLLCIDDVHFADPSTVEFLSVLKQQGGDVPLLILVGGRQLSHKLDPIVDTRHHLDPLSHGASVHIVASIVGASLPSTDLSRLARQADGVPLFAEELARGAAHKGAAPQSGDDADNIPPTLVSYLLARLDRLGPGKRVAQVAAVLGRDFHVELLEPVAELPEQSIEAGLNELLAGSLLQQEDGVYAFRHSLFQEAAYGSLLKGERRELHARAALALSELYPELVIERPELLAHHLTLANEPERALQLWLEAATNSAERAAYVECNSLLDAAAPLLAHINDATRRRDFELWLQSLRGQAASMLFGYASPDAEAAYCRAFELCVEQTAIAPNTHRTQVLWTRLMCAQRLHSLTLGNARFSREPLFWILWGFGAYHQARAEHEKAAAVAGRMLELCDGRAELELDARFGAGSSSFFLGRFDTAISELQRGFERHTEIAPDLGATPTGHRMEVHCLEYELCAWCHRGRSALAREKLAQARALVEASDYNLGRVSTADNACYLHFMLGEWQACKANAETALERAKQYGLESQLMWASPMLSRVEVDLAIRQGRSPAQALTAMSEHATRQGHTDSRAALTMFYGLLAEALWQAERLEPAIEALQEAITLVRQAEERFWEPQLWSLKARLALACDGSHRAAIDHLRHGIDVARRQHNELLVLRLSMQRFELDRDATELAATLALLSDDVDLPEVAQVRQLAARSG